MSPGTDKRMARRRAGIALAAAGVCAAVPIGVVVAQTAGQPSAPNVVEEAVTPGGLAPGARVPDGKTLPKVLRDALAKQQGPVVAGFVLPGVNEDELVTQWLRTLEKDPKFADTKVLIYRITPQTRLKDLPEVLDLTSTPVVAVFQKDGKIAATWRGIVDSEILAQSVIDARRNIPKPVTLTPSSGGPYGEAAGIALARKVNAHYRKVPVVVETIEGTDRFPANYLTGSVDSTSTQVLQKGKRVGIYAVGTTDDGEKIEAIVNRKGAFVKRASMACWIHATPPGLGDVIGQPLLPLQVYRFGAPSKVKGAKGVVRMKMWVNSSDQPAWILRVERKSGTVLSMKRDRVTNTIGDGADTSTSSVKPAAASSGATKTAAKGAKKAAKKAATPNPMATWPTTLPTCADAG